MKTYLLKFGLGDTRVYTGLAPTFLSFATVNGATTAPSISEFATASGLYYFQASPNLAVTYLADAATTSPGATLRYVSGSIDPNDAVNESFATLIAINTTLLAISTSLSYIIGDIGSTFGGISTLPQDLFGYMMRAHENVAGNQFYSKVDFQNYFYSRGGLNLYTSTITNSISAVIKTNNLSL